MQLTALASVSFALLLATAAPGLAARGGRAGGACDDVALQAALVVLGTCSCETAAKHGQYVSCAAHAINDAVRAGTVAKACRRLLRRAAARSVCGKPGFVACCRPSAPGGQSCSIKRETACVAPACASPRPSCADACTATGCASPSGAFVGD